MLHVYLWISAKADYYSHVAVTNGEEFLDIPRDIVESELNYAEACF